LALGLFGACEGRPDTIISISASELVSTGTAVDTLELIDLGIDPDSILFTRNTFCDYDRVYQNQVRCRRSAPKSIPA
jgi:hypothetical protein